MNCHRLSCWQVVSKVLKTLVCTPAPNDASISVCLQVFEMSCVLVAIGLLLLSFEQLNVSRTRLSTRSFFIDNEVYS